MRIECSNEIHSTGGDGLFILGKAETVLDTLMPELEGKVQLIYLDPPFGTGDTFSVRLRDTARSVKIPVYSDQLTGEQYIEWMRAILTGCHRLLKACGSIYLHIDYRESARIRLLLDELFGEKNFMNEIIWSYKSGGRSTRYYPRKHDTILFYRKSPSVLFDLKPIGKPRGREKRNHMKRFIDEDGRICFSIRSGGKTYYYSEDTPVYPTDVWTDIEHLQQKDSERTGYSTQKPEALLRRIVLSSSRPGDIVADLFAGSGTTAAVARKEGRKYVAVDSSGFSLMTFRKRLLKDAENQGLEESPVPRSSEMILRYPVYAGPAGIDYEFVPGKNYDEIRLLNAGFEDVYPISYAAAGQMDGNGCFHPLAWENSIRFPLLFRIPHTDKPLIQIADASGKQAFFTIE